MTKKKKALLAAVACSAVLAGAIGLAACTGKGGGHTCEWETDWTYDAQNLELGHWHKCTDSSCNKVNGTTGHTWTDNDWVEDTENAGHDKRECPDCHATESRVTPVPHDHDWGNWEIATEDDNPTTERGGKATRTCYGEGECDATAELKELPLPKIEGDVYTVIDSYDATCSVDGQTIYTYTVGEGDDEETIYIYVTTPADESLHNWSTDWHFDDETGHYHLCEKGCESTHEEHDELGTHVQGECSVCGYLPAVEWTVAVDETTHQATKEGVYVSEANRVIKLKGLVDGNDYELSTNNENVTLGSGGMGSSGKTIIFTYHEVEKGEGMPINIISDEGTGEQASVTLTIEDKGEHIVPFEGKTIELAEPTNFTNYGFEQNVYAVVITEPGNYEITLFSVTEADVDVCIGSRLDEAFGGGYEIIRLVEANGGKYALEAGTYYVGVISKEMGNTTVGSIAIAKEGTTVEAAKTISVGENKTLATLDTTGITLTFQGVEAGEYYKLSCENENVVFNVGPQMNVSGSITFEYGVMTLTVTVQSTDGELENVVIKLETAEAPNEGDDDNVTVIELGAAAEVDNDGWEASVYKIEITEGGNYSVSFTGFEAADVIFGVGTGYNEYLSGEVNAENGVYTLEAGTYYISIMSNKADDNFNPLSVSGTMTVAPAAAE